MFGGYLPQIDLYTQRSPDAFHNLVLTGNAGLHSHVVLSTERNSGVNDAYFLGGGDSHRDCLCRGTC